MISITIDDNIRTMAKSFRKELKEGHGTYVSPLTKLSELKDKLSGAPKQYVQHIIDKWEELLIAEPKDFIAQWEKEFNAIIPTKDIDTVKTPEDELLYDKIVEAMRYDYVQSRIYPQYMAQLEIKTCVYCNAQYSFAVKGALDYINYQLDHYLPKSKYPYLCTTFMNLQPCCPKCNQIKSNRVPNPSEEELFQLFTADANPVSPVKFSLPRLGIARYMVSLDSKDLMIKFDCPGNQKLLNGYNRYFHVSDLYQAHRDVAEELIWKQKIYNRIFIDIYKDQFKRLGFKDSHFARFILGNFEQPKDIHKRPLAKMTQDIAEQLEILKKIVKMS